ncbi:hypothetical protein [Ciceribacter sp. L1K23]|uniref:hypothetical protein n=1 Tax=Ciceribacter sp. L1K23 TaxID=2820276 RepID=UPI001BA53AB6|nr:hypothetical protein [Ciceribacter sp. L1K23]
MDSVKFGVASPSDIGQRLNGIRIKTRADGECFGLPAAFLRCGGQYTLYLRAALLQFIKHAVEGVDGRLTIHDALGDLRSDHVLPFRDVS